MPVPNDDGSKTAKISAGMPHRLPGSWTRWSRACLAVASWWLVTTDVWAQNDWQFPDPYFGVVEFGKSRPAEAEQRPQVEGERHVPPAARARSRRVRRRHAAATARR